jgi:hypothetical protein
MRITTDITESVLDRLQADVIFAVREMDSHIELMEGLNKIEMDPERRQQLSASILMTRLYRDYLKGALETSMRDRGVF